MLIENESKLLRSIRNCGNEFHYYTGLEAFFGCWKYEMMPYDVASHWKIIDRDRYRNSL